MKPLYERSDVSTLDKGVSYSTKNNELADDPFRDRKEAEMFDELFLGPSKPVYLK